MCEPEDEDRSYYAGGTVSKRGNSKKPRPALPRVDRHSSAYFRMAAAGFTIGDVFTAPQGHFQYCAVFTCVCGRMETLWFGPGSYEAATRHSRVVDVAAIIEDNGSTGLKHLKEDGFTKEQIMEIRRAYV